jgi:N-methylhydantoinase B/oxoprolinase/acetone carboxylase alpha subunit
VADEIAHRPRREIGGAIPGSCRNGVHSVSEESLCPLKTFDRPEHRAGQAQ